MKDVKMIFSLLASNNSMQILKSKLYFQIRFSRMHCLLYLIQKKKGKAMYFFSVYLYFI